MTTADPNKVKAIYAEKLNNKKWKLDNRVGIGRAIDAAASMSPAEAARHIADEAREAGVSEQASSNGCFLFAASVVSLLAIVVTAVLS